MKRLMTVLFAVALLAGCKEPPPRTTTITRDPALAAVTHRIETPVEMPSSELLGLTEAEVLTQQGLKELNPEHGAPDKKWFSGGIIQFPRTPGDSYVIERCHVLTFKNDKVVRHELVDRRTAHVTMRPREK